MNHKDATYLTDAEWEVMDFLWDRPNTTGREICENLEIRAGWKRSTSLTLLSRLVAKGAVKEEKDGKIKTFVPMVDREDARISETKSFLEKVYNGSLSMMVSSLTKRQALSQEEIEELYEILKKNEVKRT